MKGLVGISGVFAAVLFAGSALAQGQDAEGRGRRPGRQGPPPWANAGGNHDDDNGRPDRPERPERPSLADIDTDGDGRVSDAEREAFREKKMEEARARVLEHFDENGDGVLSGEELNKVARALMHRRPGQGRPGHGRRPGGACDGEGHKPGRQGPPPWANAGGNSDGRQGPPPWANAGGRGRGRGPADE
ncbi:MAG: EF-hand domain-containing protein [Planctomycetota bacterium]|jgi:hypothetical protein